MSTKYSAKPAQWTAFWKSLGVQPEKRSRLSKYSYDALTKKASRPLKNIGVSADEIEKAAKHFARYTDKTVFYNFSRFFRIDPTTVKYWVGAKDVSAAFGKTVRIFQRNTFEHLKSRFAELYWLHQFNTKGEGWNFEAEFTKRKSIFNIDLARLTRLLNKADERFTYRGVAKFRVGDELYLCLTRLTERPIPKFVVLQRTKDKLQMRISADTRKEVGLIKVGLRNEFGVLIDAAEQSGSFANLNNFLRSGTSRHFLLAGVTLLQDQYRLMLSPKFNMPLNVADYSLYQDRLVRMLDPTTSLVQVRLHHLQTAARRPISVDVRNHQTSEIVGAVLLDLNDRKLNRNQRKVFRADFQSDFGIPLGTFIRTKDIAGVEIYDRLLQTTMRKSTDFILRSPGSLKIVRGLVDQGLIEWPIKSQDQPRYCTNRICARRYEAVSSGKHCDTCGEILLPGKEITVSQVSERRVADYVTNVLSTWDMDPRLLKRKVLGRSIYVIEVDIKGRNIQLIPATRPFSIDQLAIIRLRYDGAYLLSSREDVQSLVEANLGAEELSRFVYELDNKSKTHVERSLNDHALSQLTRVRNEATSSEKRMSDNRTYAAKERTIKNLGAELFEADAAVILRYMFGNSIWLGARTRGSALPDGMTALPVTGSKNGCFLWDAKYGKGQKVRLGKDDKNLLYIREGRKNESLKSNGHLKAMLFISNTAGPQNFESKYKKLLKRRRIGKFKIVFLTSKQLLILYEHYRKYEDLILSNQAIQDKFVKSLKGLLFSTIGGKTAVKITDSEVTALVTSNEADFARLQVPRVRST